MVAIENQIEQFSNETASSVDLILGSDDHLDLILSVKKPLDTLTSKFVQLNETLHKEINNYPIEVIENLIYPKLKELNKICVTMIGSMRTSFLYSSIRESLKKYQAEHELLRELMYDIHHYKLNDNPDMDDLLREINSL